jgi:CRP-like cAMP-binding protein
MSDGKLTNTLKELRFLHDIADKHLERIAKISHLRDFDDGDVLFREGEPAENVYLVVFGSVSLEVCGPGVGCRRILTVGPGEIVGWSAVLEQTRLTATARVLTPTRVVEIEAGKLLNICENDPGFGFEIMRRTALALAKRLSGTRMQLLDLYASNPPATAHVTEENNGR